MIDVVLVAILAVLIAVKKSRTAAVILFVYFILSKILMIAESPNTYTILPSIIWGVAYFSGIQGTFAYHKIIKQQENFYETW